MHAMWTFLNGPGYDDARTQPDPRVTVLDFYESAYQAGARRAGWDIDRYACLGGITDPHASAPQATGWWRAATGDATSQIERTVMAGPGSDRPGGSH
jgi:uncharacterized protein DUF5996